MDLILNVSVLDCLYEGKEGVGTRLLRLLGTEHLNIPVYDRETIRDRSVC